MQQELIEMLEKVTEHIVICNNYDQRFSSTSYGANLLKEAEALVEKAKNSAKEPAVPQGERVSIDRELWDAFIKLYNRYASGDPKVPFFEIRESLGAVIEDATPASPSQPVPFDQWNSSPYTQVLHETIKDLSQKLASMTQSQPVTLTDDWAECKRISEIPAVDEALRLFAEGETTEDQAVAIVQAIIAALREKEGGV